MAIRLATHISGDPAAKALRQLAAELEHQAARIDQNTLQQGGCT
jgi:hypothetical protein